MIIFCLLRLKRERENSIAGETSFEVMVPHSDMLRERLYSNHSLVRFELYES